LKIIALSFSTLYPNYQSLRLALQAGHITCVELVEHYLHNISEKNGSLNAFVEVYDHEARQQAVAIDASFKAGNPARLAGMVIGIKDILCYKNHASQAGSKILSGFKSQFTGTAVQRLIDEGAIIIGRQNCDEFGMGSSNENSTFGPVRHLLAPNRVPGGSSGGSAVAVAADMCFASIGTDTGGSVRMPAAFCGVVGLKPTYSRVSRWGLIAYGSSFDTIGPICRSVEDAALLLEIMAGLDEQDSTVSERPVPPYSKELVTDRKWKVGYIRESVGEHTQPEVRQKTIERLEWLKAQGHQVEPVEFSLMPYLLPTYYILTTAEVSSNLSRFDGVRYGYRSADATNLESLYKKSRTEGLGLEARRRVILGTFVLSASYYDAYYTKAQKVRRLIKEETERIFEQYDVIVSPTVAQTAFEIGAKASDPLQMYLTDLLTVQANVVGMPAISIPNGVDNDGLPIGLQVLAPAFAELELLQFSKILA
jgi:aspartyl-tRNA(Asn)/glutamyl-tRNA(Gln) amidotransferase subunit A